MFKMDIFVIKNCIVDMIIVSNITSMHQNVIFHMRSYDFHDMMSV